MFLLELEAATQHGLVIIIVMISITTWAAAVEIVVTFVVMSLTRNTAQFVHALIQMEVEVEQQLAQLLQQLLLTQVIMH